MLRISSLMRSAQGMMRGSPPSYTPYSHSIVAGGLLVTSYTTRFTPATSFVIRPEIFRITPYGNSAQSAVIPSELSTVRNAMHQS